MSAVSIEQNLPDGTGSFDQKVVRERAIALTDIRAERGTVTWCDVLTEEVAEALAESDEDELRKELIQSAAVCVKWIEAIDRRRGCCSQPEESHDGAWAFGHAYRKSGT